MSGNESDHLYKMLWSYPKRYILSTFETNIMGARQKRRRVKVWGVENKEEKTNKEYNNSKK